jgi:hypothetical protein
MKIIQSLLKMQITKNMWKKRIWGTALLLASLISLTSCATIMRGDHRDVRFNSDPPGADVYIDGILFGRTPIVLQLKAGQSCVAEFRKEGYRTEIRQIKSRIKAEWLILDVIFGTVPVIVDAITGSWSDFNPNYFNVAIEKIEAESK